MDQEEHSTVFRAKVHGTKSYTTSIALEFSGKIKTIYSCTCPAFHSDGCKHIAALAYAIESDYAIDEQAKQIYKKWNITAAEENWADYNNDDFYEENTKEMSQQLRLLEDIIPAIHKRHPELSINKIIEAVIKYGPQEVISVFLSEGVLPSSTQKHNQPRILSLLEDKNISHKTEQKHYRLKVDFSAISRMNKDLYLSLYECKELKNGSLSSGRELSQSSGRSLPGKYRKLVPFLRESSSYYSSSLERLSFRNAPDFFVQVLRDAREIYNTSSDQRIEEYEETYRLRVEVEKQDGSYRLYGVLVSDSTMPILTRWLPYIPSDTNEGWYASAVLRENALLFFRTPLPSSLVKALFEEEILLSEEEKDMLVASDAFDRLASSLPSIESLGVVPATIIPTILFRLTIPESFDRVECEGFFDYDGYFLPSNDTRPYLRLSDGRWIARNHQIEDMQTNRPEIQEFLRSFDGSMEGRILLKQSDDTIDAFFDRIVAMADLKWVRFEYLQDTKRFTTKTVGVKVQVKTGIDWFDTTVNVTVGDEVSSEGAMILAGIRKRQKFVLLDNGTTVILRNSLHTTIEELEEIGIDTDKIEEPQRISRHMIGALRSNAKSSPLSFQLDTQTKALKKSFENFAGIPDVVLPSWLKATLRDYQITGYNWLSFLYNNNFSGILADDMGLGKTIQTIAFLSKLYEDKSLQTPSLIVCPTSLVFNWLDEFHRFAPKVKIGSIMSTKTDWKTLPKGVQVIVISYTVLSLLTETLLDRDFHVIVLDEAQNIKNSQAKRTKNLSLLRSHHRIALSGTPIENNLNELRSIFHFLMPGFLGGEKTFRDRYIGAEKAVLMRLSDKIRPFILRRTKDQVATELPPKVEETVFLDMSEPQAKYYNTLKNAYKERVLKKVAEDGFQKSQFFVLEALMRLRQACLTPRLVSDDAKTPDDSIKLTYLEENIEEIVNSGHSVLVFSQFPSFLAFVRTLLDTKGIIYDYLDGGTKNRKELVESFNAWKTKVFLISLKAGGTGLNLVSADYVIHLDPWWNPAVENQATDRAHRIGQTRTVFVQKLIVRGTIEEKVLELQNSKKRLVDDVFSGDWTGKFDEKDLKKIFE